jgi:hypothetical protein
VLWAGTGDGLIQYTTDGGAKWTNVSPPGIKPWTRIFNMDAGHFDTLTAYAVANTMRIDDMNPHLWRTHDGGKTWTEINNGIASGAVTNSIREDPRKKGVLYAGTDTQVWVSFDDGDHWSSLRLNMPAISVRDVQVKDDASCLCSDLVVGTHGRGFWILDNITPLRQQAELTAANGPYLYKPPTGIRVRFGMNDPTPWPPELPAGENPLPGALIDYYLPAGASSAVKLEILDGTDKVVRTYSSDDPVRSPDPATDPAGYNKVCQQNPGAADCGLPLYWPAPPIVLSATAGMHRFSWDTKYQPLGEGGGGRGGGGAGGAVPHRTYPSVSAPWAPPGSYKVRLTAGGKALTQPLELHLDPRVNAQSLGVQTLNRLTKEMYDGALKSHAAAEEARELSAKLESAQGATAETLKKQIADLEPASAPAAGGRGGGRGGGGRGGRGGGPQAAGTNGLYAVSAQMMAAAMSMQAAEAAPTAREVAACAEAQRQFTAIMAKWTAIKTQAASLK